MEVSRPGLYWYLKHRNKPWKYAGVTEKMMEILREDEYNDKYGRERMYQALIQKYPDDEILSERTIYRIMKKIGISHRPKRIPNGITKADKEAQKSDDLIKLI